MRFKSNSQRKAVMAKLRSGELKRFSSPGKQGSVIMDVKALDAHLKRAQGSLDSDGDGVVNKKDCRPLDARKQGLIHDLIKKKQDYVKSREKKLETEQDTLLKDIDKESTTLSKHLAVQKKINDNKKLKQELSELKKANFRQTRTGRIYAVITGSKAKAGYKRLGKNLSKIFK